MYAQISGGTVDYGAVHAEKHGHNRFGRTYSGFAPNWSETNKVHLVGHSMGGQTIRTLVQLLKEGSFEEKNYVKNHPDIKISPLFEGGKSYVHSVTTLATLTTVQHLRMVVFCYRSLKIYSLQSQALEETIIYHYMILNWINGV